MFWFLSSPNLNIVPLQTLWWTRSPHVCERVHTHVSIINPLVYYIHVFASCSRWNCLIPVQNWDYLKCSITRSTRYSFLSRIWKNWCWEQSTNEMLRENMNFYNVLKLFTAMEFSAVPCSLNVLPLNRILHITIV